MKKLIFLVMAVCDITLSVFATPLTADYAVWKAAQVANPKADLQYILDAKAAGTLLPNDPIYLRYLASLAQPASSDRRLDQAPDWCPGLVIPIAPYTDSGTTCGYADDEFACFNSAPDVMYEFTPTMTAAYEVNLQGSNYDTRLEIRHDGPCPGNIQDCCNDDYYGLQSRCLVTMTAGITYYIIVDGYSSYCGSYVLNVIPPQPVGRCCYNDYNSCVDNITQTECQNNYGGVWDEGLNCTDDPCPPPPVGRCCYSGNLCVDNVSQWVCQNTYGGDWTQGLDCNTPCPLAPGGPLCNTVVCVQTDVDGDFNIGTADGRSLLYYWPSSPWSTDIRVRVDGLVYNLDSPGAGCSGNATFVSRSNDGICLTVVYTLLGYLDIVVTHTPVLFSPTTGAILTRTVVYNHDTVPHAIGVLYEYDTTVDGDDAAELYYGPTHLLNETCFDAPFDVTYWDAIPASGTLVGRGTFTGGEAVTPDHLAFGQWGGFYGTCWDRVCSGLPYGDSAVLYQWDEDPVPPGSSRTVATYYGVGELEVVPGDLQLSVAQPPLQCVNGEIQPDPFQLLVNVTNTGGSTCNNITINVTCNNGPGGTAVVLPPNPQVVPSLSPGNNAARSFGIDLTSTNPAGGCIFFDVVVTADNCPQNQVLGYCVMIPPCTPPCVFHSEDNDMGDLAACNYPTLVCNPSHELTGVAWLGPAVTGELAPNILNLDPADDGVIFLPSPPHDYGWDPCTPRQVQVMITAGPNFWRYYECGGHLYLSAWKDGNLDGDFCDTLCEGTAPEWIIQDVPVMPGVFVFTFLDPGVTHMGRYDGIFRFRLLSGRHGPQGFGWADPLNCPDMWCGTFSHDSIGEVEDYILEDFQWAVELQNFNAIQEGQLMAVTWKTASETANDHFELVRNDAVVASVPTLGNDAEGHAYRYDDRDVVPGTLYTYKLVAVGINGDREELASRTVAMSNLFSGVVTKYALHQNFPNPFNPVTHLAFNLLESGFTTLKVYNLMGQEVATVVNGTLNAGAHVVAFDAGELPSGVYLYRLTVNGFVAEKKMLLMK